MAKHKDFAAFLAKKIAADADLADAVDRERLNGEIATLIYEKRSAAGLTQKQLADKAGTHQSVIARLEDAEYTGRSIEPLRQVLRALGLRLVVSAQPLADDIFTGDILPYKPRLWQVPVGSLIEQETNSAAKYK